MSKTHKTAKGTELPILNLRGRDYLEVKYRLVWFREEHPTWSIETEFVSVTATAACAKAIVRDEKGRVIATSHKFENQQGFPDFLEKAETGAIGRALALIGYGTQFCADELDEGDRIVDSPVAHATNADKPGDFRVPFGKKYRGKAVSEIPRTEIESYLDWLEADAQKKNTPLSLDALQLKQAVGLFYEGQTSGSPANPGPSKKAS